MINKYSTLFIEFDALFDTRLALINSYGKEALKKCLNVKYFTRTIDKFPDIDYDEFQSKYKQRDKSLLADSLITPIVYMLTDFVFSTVKNAINGPEALQPRIILNTFPYKLEEEEHKNIADLIMEMTKGYAIVEFVYRSTKELIPAYVRDNIDIMILYDYTVWLETHSETEAFNRVVIPSVSLLAPKIFFKLPDKAVIGELERDKVDPFETMMQYAAPIIGLKLLPIHMFSLNVKPDSVEPA